MERDFIRGAVLILFVGVTAGVGWADTVYLKDGTVKQGKIVSEDDNKVVLEQDIKGVKATIHIPRADIGRIERDKEGEMPAEAADPAKESERLAKQMDEYCAKARANVPSSFKYEYEPFPDDRGVFRFKDNGRMWKARTDLCVSYCEKAMDVGRKRIALLRKFPDNPQFQKDSDSTKTRIVEMYTLEQKVLLDREKKGRWGGE